METPGNVTIVDTKTQLTGMIQIQRSVDQYPNVTITMKFYGNSSKTVNIKQEGKYKSNQKLK